MHWKKYIFWEKYTFIFILGEEIGLTNVAQAQTSPPPPPPRTGSFSSSTSSGVEQGSLESAPTDNELIGSSSSEAASLKEENGGGEQEEEEHGGGQKTAANNNNVVITVVDEVVDRVAATGGGGAGGGGNKALLRRSFEISEANRVRKNQKSSQQMKNGSASLVPSQSQNGGGAKRLSLYWLTKKIDNRHTCSFEWCIKSNLFVFNFPRE